MTAISMYFDVISCDIKYSDYIFMYKDYYVTTYFLIEKEILEILIEILGKEKVKKTILNELITIDLSKFDGNKAFDHIGFYVAFNVDLDEETLFYIKLKYPDSYNMFNRKIRN